MFLYELLRKSDTSDYLIMIETLLYMKKFDNCWKQWELKKYCAFGAQDFVIIKFHDLPCDACGCAFILQVKMNEFHIKKKVNSQNEISEIIKL